MEIRDVVPSWMKHRHMPFISEDNLTWESLSHDLEKFFKDSTKHFSYLDPTLPRVFKSNFDKDLKIIPRIDLSENHNQYIIEVDLPGVKEEDLDISVSGDKILTIKGKREIETDKKERNYYKLERSYGSFERSLSLPDSGDSKEVNAVFKNSVLTITMPKKEQHNDEVKKIKISNN